MSSQFKGKKGLGRVWNATRISISGLREAFVHESAFRQEVCAAIVLIPLAFFMPVAGAGKAMMVLSVLLVLMAELVNSAIEALTDRVSLDYHVLAKRAKDVGSAVVMVALIGVPVVWALVLWG